MSSSTTPSSLRSTFKGLNMHIKDRLAKTKTQSKDEPELYSEYNNWKQEIIKAAGENASNEVTQRLTVVHDAETKAHIARLDAATAKTESADARRNSAVAELDGVRSVMGERIAHLEKSLFAVQGNWSATKTALSNATEGHIAQILAEQDKVQNLTMQVANLEGQLTEASKVKKIKLTQPKMHEFEFTPTRNVDGFTTKWTAKAKGLN